jgi:hypothetical protein
MPQLAFSCPKCEASFHNQHGLNVHTSRMHNPTKAASKKKAAPEQTVATIESKAKGAPKRQTSKRARSTNGHKPQAVKVLHETSDRIVYIDSHGDVWVAKNVTQSQPPHIQM